MKKLILITLLLTQGCVGSTQTSLGEHFQMSGTPEGLRAYNDGIIGALKTAKEKPDAHNQYFAERNLEEQNITARKLHKPVGFIQKLFEADNAPTSSEQNAS